jgi:hypothetical protein
MHDAMKGVCADAVVYMRSKSASGCKLLLWVILISLSKMWQCSFEIELNA